MESAYLLIPLSLILLAVDHEQFEELEHQADKILGDD
jgi:nitrogen fixation-related uncharacterized protein